MPKRWPRPKTLLFTDAPIRTAVVADSGGSGPGGSITTPTRFVSRWDSVPGVGAVELTVSVKNGRPRATDLIISNAAGVAGVRFGSMRVDSVSVESLIDQAVEAASFGVVSAEGHRAIRAATRRRVDDKRLQEIADAYRRDGIEGVTQLHIGERQGWRLVKRARLAGLLPEGNDR